MAKLSLYYLRFGVGQFNYLCFKDDNPAIYEYIGKSRAHGWTNAMTKDEWRAQFPMQAEKGRFELLGEALYIDEDPAAHKAKDEKPKKRKRRKRTAGYTEAEAATVTKAARGSQQKATARRKRRARKRD